MTTRAIALTLIIGIISIIATLIITEYKSLDQGRSNTQHTHASYVVHCDPTDEQGHQIHWFDDYDNAMTAFASKTRVCNFHTFRTGEAE